MYEEEDLDEVSNKKVYKDYPLNFQNKDYIHIRNKPIEEYDIRLGGYNIAIYNNLLTEDEIEICKLLSRSEKHVFMGNKGKDKEFTKNLFDGFIKAITLFRSSNEIEDDNILSIKKDSITIINTKIKHTTFDNLEFISKGKYTSYFYINKKEFYYNNADDSLVIKGLNDIVVNNHPLIDEIKYIIKLSEYASKEEILNYLKELRKNYLNKDLINEYYLELSPMSSYKLKLDSCQGVFYSKYISDDNINDIDISYNYINFILPFIKILV